MNYPFIQLLWSEAQLAKTMGEHRKSCERVGTWRVRLDRDLTPR
jgi:hypothetical protein